MLDDARKSIDFIKIKNYQFLLFTFVASVLMFYQKFPGLMQPSLWLDDQWVASMMRAPLFFDFFKIPAATPIGFLSLERLMHWIVPDPEISLLLIPFLAGCLLPLACATFLFRLTGAATSSFVLFWLVSLCPFLSSVATVKQYTLEALIIVLILHAAIPLFKKESNQVSRTLFVLSVVSLFFCFPAVIVSIPLMNFLLIRTVLKKQSVRKYFETLSGKRTLCFNVSVFFVYIFFMRPRGNQMMKDIWWGHFIPLNSMDELRTFLEIMPNLYMEALIVSWLHWLFFVGVSISFFVSLYFRQHLRYFCFVVLFFFSFALMSALKIYPIGGGRTDVFTLGVVLTFGLYGFAFLEAKFLKSKYQIFSMFIVCALFYAYPILSASPGKNSDSLVVEYMDRELTQDDSVIVFPHSQWAASYYSKWPSEYRKSWVVGHNFESFIQRPNTLVLPNEYGGRNYWEKPEVLTGLIKKFTETRDSFYFIYTFGEKRVLDRLLAAVESLGFHSEVAFQPGGAKAMNGVLFFRRSDEN